VAATIVDRTGTGFLSNIKDEQLSPRGGLKEVDGTVYSTEVRCSLVAMDEFPITIEYVLPTALRSGKRRSAQLGLRR